jgi:adenosylmethionine-8-amino-7-oxononanoate aminotransferase
MAVKTWLSTHIYYNKDLDQLLVDGLDPLIMQFRKEKKIEDFFFIRYWNGGPHIRLRLGLTGGGQDLQQELTRGLQAYFAKHPSDEFPVERYREQAARMGRVEERATGMIDDPRFSLDMAEPLHAMNTFEFRDYAYDSFRFGGENGRVISEDHFIKSSKLALTLVLLTPDQRGIRLTIALHLAAAAMVVMDLPAAESVELLQGLREGFRLLLSDEPSPLGAVPGFATYEQEWADFDPLRQRLRGSSHIPGMSVDIKDLIRLWENEFSLRWKQLHDVFAKGELEREPRYLFLDYIHLMNNRLGLTPLEESYIYYLVASGINDINKDPEERGAEKYWGPFKGKANIPGIIEIHDENEASALLTDLMLTNQDDIGEYVKLAGDMQGEVLEIGCGSGRITLALANAGHSITGLDNSAEMVRILQNRMSLLSHETQDRVRTVTDDATKFELDRKFQLIIVPYCSIVVFFTREERLAVLRRAAQHLATGGILAFDYPVFDLERKDLWNESVFSLNYSIDDTEIKAQLGIKVQSDYKCLLGNIYFEVTGPDAPPQSYLQVRRHSIIDSKELAGLLEEAGLTVIERKMSPMLEGVSERCMLYCTQAPPKSYPLWHPYHGAPGAEENVLMLVSGKGATVKDQNGREYIDLSGGLWSAQCGLGHPKIIDAVSRQLEHLSYGTLFLARSNRAAVSLARELVAMAPAPLGWAYLTGSGSESVELAIKLARLYQKLQKRPLQTDIVYLDRSYHGTFFGSMGVSGLVDDKDVFSPLLTGVSAIRTPMPEDCPEEMSYEEFSLQCAHELEVLIERTGSVAAFIIEPVLGSAGVVIPPPEYFREIRSICRKYDVLLIVDEVATGFGRTGKWFASEHFDIEPDIMALAKGINSGYLPLGAVLFSAKVGQPILRSGISIAHGSSHNGNPACAAAALATIEVIRDEHLIERAGEMGNYFRQRLEELKIYSSLSDVRSLGMMLGISFRQKGGEAVTPNQLSVLCTALQNCGILSYPGLTGLVFMPALVISKKEIDSAIEILHGLLSTLRFENDSVQFIRQPGS